MLARLAVAISGWLGTRFSEAFGLKWMDMDFTRKRVSFIRGVSQGRITRLKNKASRTDQPVPDEVLKLLRKWRTLTPYSAPDDWVFASPFTQGKRPYWPAALMANHIRPLLRELGFPEIGWHGLRHSMSAWAKGAGFHRDQITTLLRQDTLEMASVYGEMDIEPKRQLQQRLVKYIKLQAKKKRRHRTRANKIPRAA
jgi:integrase